MDGTATFGGTGGDAGADAGSVTSQGPADTGALADDTTAADGDESGDGATTGGIAFDLGVPDDGGRDECSVVDLDGPPPACDETAPAETFDTPTLEWSFGESLEDSGKTWATPLVGNLTDDNRDGVIDLCDTPDVVLVARAMGQVCNLYILDGASGDVHLTIDDVHCDITPALGDLDGDGVMEIVTATSDQDFVENVVFLQAFDADGTQRWQSEQPYNNVGGGWSGTGIALHDLDGDGATEILLESSVHDRDGTMVWNAHELPGDPLMMVGAPFAADLDGDGDQEYVHGAGIVDLRPDGAGAFEDTPGGLTYALPNPTGDQILAPPRLASVADLLPEHPGPEVFFSSGAGYYLWTADGSFPWGEQWRVPEGIEDCDHSSSTHWGRPASIHDFDGDGLAEVAISACHTFMLLDITEDGPEVVWTSTVDDDSGSSASTSFDFLGDGSPEPIYSDESTAWVWTADGEGGWETRMQLARKSGTIIEYPVVADVDNDGSAEILVVSFDNDVPALQVFGTEDDNWVQPRRIWNQHAYMVTNVREDGTIPAQPVANWTVLNTFRANSPIDNGGICVPEG